MVCAGIILPWCVEVSSCRLLLYIISDHCCHQPLALCPCTRAVEAVQDAPSCREAIAARLAVINAGLAEVGAIGWDFFPPIGPHCLTIAQATQLQSWVGGASNPRAWVEV